METKAIGLYVHIPFCVRKCNYCDFCSFNLSEASWKDRYISQLCEEIYSYREERIKVDSIFFGGGTPTLLTPDEFRKIFLAIEDSFEILADSEFTVEANPKTLDREKLRTYKECGVNRLSIGLQSIHENELKILGRIHSYEDFLASYKLAGEFGISNLNVDLMYGIPEQTIESFGITLEKLIALKPQHISLYGLILENGTPLYKMKDTLSFPSEDEECDMYYLAAQKLSDAGYSHYEISNYALPGRECSHNLKYWHCDEYIGIGLSAYSYFEGKRFGNLNDKDVYLSDSCISYKRNYDSVDESYEFVMLGLRLREGISLKEYESRFGISFLHGRKEIIDRLVAFGYISIEGDRLHLTEQGFYVSNAILTELI